MVHKLQQEEGQSAQNKEDEQGNKEMFFTNFVIEDTAKTGDNRCAHDYDGNGDNESVAKTKGFDYKVHKIREKGLLRNTNHAGGGKTNVHHLVFLNNRGFESVEGVFDKRIVFDFGKIRLVFQQKH